MISIKRIGQGKRFLFIGKYNISAWLKFVWQDLWVGAYWDRQNRCVHICLIPTICLKIRVCQNVSEEELMTSILHEIKEKSYIETLSNEELVSAVLNSSDGVADNWLVLELLNRVLPNWENIEL